MRWLNIENAVGRRGRESVKYRITCKVMIVWCVSAAMDGRYDW